MQISNNRLNTMSAMMNKQIEIAPALGIRVMDIRIATTLSNKLLTQVTRYASPQYSLKRLLLRETCFTNMFPLPHVLKGIKIVAMAVILANFPNSSTPSERAIRIKYIVLTANRIANPARVIAELPANPLLNMVNM